MNYKSRFDILSILLSMFCLLHCLLLPLFLTTIPLWGFKLLENQFIEGATLLLSLCVGGYAIRLSLIKLHKSSWVIGFFIVGMFALAAGNFLSGLNEVVLKLGGACLVIMAHIQNWRLSRKCVTHSSIPELHLQNKLVNCNIVTIE